MKRQDPINKVLYAAVVLLTVASLIVFTLATSARAVGTLLLIPAGICLLVAVIRERRTR